MKKTADFAGLWSLFGGWSGVVPCGSWIILVMLGDWFDVIVNIWDTE